MKKSILILLFIAVSFATVRAQDSTRVTWGVKFGISRASASRSNSESDDNSIKMKGFSAYTVSIVIDVPLSKVLSIQPAASIAKKGEIRDVRNSSNDEDFRITYLDVPVNFVYKYKKFYGGVGPYIATALSGTHKTGSSKKDVRFGDTYITATNKNNDDWQPLDWGGSAIIGYKLGKFTFSINYELGLRDVEPNPYYTTKTRMGAFAVGLMF